MYEPEVYVEDIVGKIVTLTVDGKEIIFNLDNVLDMSEQTITKDMAVQSATYGYIAMILAKAEKHSNNCKRDKEVAYAATDQKVRTKLLGIGAKFTEAVVKAGIEQDENYQADVDYYDSSVFAVGVLKMLVKSLDMKSNMLISMGAMVRSEMGMTGMHIKTDSYEQNIDNMKENLKKKKV